MRTSLARICATACTCLSLGLMGCPTLDEIVGGAAKPNQTGEYGYSCSERVHGTQLGAWVEYFTTQAARDAAAKNHEAGFGPKHHTQPIN